MRRTPTRIAACLTAALILSPATPVSARAGFAEWEVYTPGGHLISDTDLHDRALLPLLRTDAQPDAGDAEILLTQLRRWRYYRDHVAGEHAGGYFVFRESNGELTLLDSLDEMEGALRARGVGRAESPWLTSRDGWREAWFPFMVWRPCRLRLGGDAEALGFTAEQVETLRRADGAFLSESECRAAMAPEWFELYRRTTWGRQCRGWASSGKSLEAEVAFLELFCRELLVPPQP